MKRRGTYGLQPLGDFARQGRSSAEARAERRLAACWPLVVGPALEKHTRLIRIRNRVLIMGCSEANLVPSLRQSVEATWPQVQERLERLFKFRLTRIEVVPCDPTPEAAAPAAEPTEREDPFLSVLKAYRKIAKEAWTRAPD